DPSPDSIVDLARRRLTSQDLGHEVADNGLASFAGPFCTGFGAGEYAALWSEVLAADVFETFSKALPQELPELGWRFREAFLEPGAGRAPITAFQDFQGRVPK
ncbi:OOP, partial [Symbiodinium microadriaticum]